MRKKAYSDILPHFHVTSCLEARDILPPRGRDILPRHTRHPAFTQTQHPASCLFCCPVASRGMSSR